MVFHVNDLLGYRFATVLIVVAMCTSCQRDYVRPGDLVEIHGTVYLDGHPVSGARVLFVPENATLTSRFMISHGVTNQQGGFELTTSDNQEGALVGRHRVVISKANFEHAEKKSPVDNFDLENDKGDDSSDLNEVWAILEQTIEQQDGERIPSYYNVQSDLSCNVIPGVGIQDVRFELSSIDPKLSAANYHSTSDSQQTQINE